LPQPIILADVDGTLAPFANMPDLFDPAHHSRARVCGWQVILDARYPAWIREIEH